MVHDRKPLSATSRWPLAGERFVGAEGGHVRRLVKEEELLPGFESPVVDETVAVLTIGADAPERTV